MKKFKDTSNIDIEKPIKNWMAQATPRMKKWLKNLCRLITMIIIQLIIILELYIYICILAYL